jgi:ribonuclease-3
VSDGAGPDAAGQAAALLSLERRLEHRFADRGLLETALCHASYAHEAGGGRGNERLEFLGDAVLDLVVSELLYRAHPSWDEGTLTRTRAGLVNRGALADCARQLDLGPLLRLGRTEQRSGGVDKATILADAFEAVLGALYLDAGLAPVEALVRRIFGDAIARDAERDPKTEFQEWAHARLHATPRYHTSDETGTEDDEQRFASELRVGDEAWGQGRGRSKRLAERAAARVALARVRALGDG